MVFWLFLATLLVALLGGNASTFPPRIEINCGYISECSDASDPENETDQALPVKTKSNGLDPQINESDNSNNSKEPIQAAVEASE